MRFGDGPGAVVARVRWYRTSSEKYVGENCYISHSGVVSQTEFPTWVDEGKPGEVWGSRRQWVPTVDIENVPGAIIGDPLGSRSAWRGESTEGQELYSCPGPSRFRIDMGVDLEGTFAPFAGDGQVEIGVDLEVEFGWPIYFTADLDMGVDLEGTFAPFAGDGQVEIGVDLEVEFPPFTADLDMGVDLEGTI